MILITSFSQSMTSFSTTCDRPSPKKGRSAREGRREQGRDGRREGERKGVFILCVSAAEGKSHLLLFNQTGRKMLRI